MSDVLLQEPIRSKCVKCERRRATGEDGLCDHCRFMLTLQQVTVKKKE